MFGKRKEAPVTQRAIKVRLYPTKEQKVLFEKTFGCCRFVWNKMLADEEALYKENKSHCINTPATYKKDYPFLKEVDSLALANVQLDLDDAFSRFFKNPEKVGHPSFKSKKKSEKSYTTNCVNQDKNPTIQLFDDGVKLPKVGVVPAKVHRKPLPNWKLKSATVSETPTGEYFCALLFEYESVPPEEVLPTPEKTIGLDYSSPHFYVDDQGRSPEGHRYYRESEKKLARMQRQLSRMQYGSKNYEHQLHRIQELHEHIANQRKDFCHKLSREIANSYDAVCVEDLNLSAISRSLKLGKSTLDNGFGMFRMFLKYKLEEQGKHLIVIDKWFPSSKTCNECGYVNKDLTLKDRVWICPECGAIVMRDANAGKNIKEEGLREFYMDRTKATA